MIIDYLNVVIDFLLKEIPLYPVCILISVLDICFSLVILVASAMSELKFKNKIWFKDLLILTHAVILILSLLENFGYAERFETVCSAVVYTAVSFTVCGGLYCLMKLQTLFSERKRERKLNKYIQNSVNSGEVKRSIIIAEKEPEIKTSNVKRAASEVFCEKLKREMQGGYIDVAYLKSLTEYLKTKNLTTEDELEVDELELLIMNFISRQPTPNERAKLNGYLSSLIKKLAKYGVS